MTTELEDDEFNTDCRTLKDDVYDFITQKGAGAFLIPTFIKLHILTRSVFRFHHFSAFVSNPIADPW